MGFSTFPDPISLTPWGSGTKNHSSVIVSLTNSVCGTCDLGVRFWYPKRLCLYLSDKDIKNNFTLTHRKRVTRDASHLCDVETSLGTFFHEPPASPRPYLVFLDNSILMIQRRRIPGDTYASAVVASNCQHSDRLWWSTWGCRGSNWNKHRL